MLTVFGCGADSQLSTNPSTNPSANLTASTEITVAPASTETSAYFIAQLVGGGSFESAAVLESEPIAFWFWAPG